MSPLEIRRGASTSTDPRTAARELFEALAGPPAALTIIYCSPRYDLAVLGAALGELFGAEAPVIGCTTGAEITPAGYLEGSLTGVSIGGPGVVAHVERIDHLRDLSLAQGGTVAERSLAGMRAQGVAPSARNCFGFLIADGLAMQEEPLVSALHGALHGISLFGGSAGDGTRFAATYLYHQGQFRTDVAVFTLVSTPHPFVVFKTDHFHAGDAKMVVTEAEPARRIVTEINGLPAAREYARLVGLEIDKLTPMVFAAHPVVVRIGGQTYVRAIQKVNADDSLTFFCAIDEGVPLTVAAARDIVDDLAAAFARVGAEIGRPALVLGCDCILRWLEIEQRDCRAAIDALFAANNVIGFATYGEQYNSMHVNQTFTGVALAGG